jgi:nicotinamide-nucleotide amidase
MTAAVLCIGTEITRGEIVNTNANWLCGKLTELGFEVTEGVSVDDDRARVKAALQRLSAQHELIACTGGLGPTTDDLTAESVALAAGLPLVRHADTVAAMQERFRRLGRTMVAANLKQADFPSGATVLANAVGTAPGFALEMRGAKVLFFPGVPAEMKRIWADHVEAWLRPLGPGNTFQARLRTFGQPESTVGERLSGVEQAHPGVVIGYRASFPEIEVKVFARGNSPEDAHQRVAAAKADVLKRIGSIVYGEDDTTLVAAVASRLRAAKRTLAVAESCTGGLVAHMITSEPASDYLLGALVTYSNQAKTALLGVPSELIEKRGAVSAEVAVQMAQGARRVTGASLGLGITGIAGPTGGTPEKPVGSVHWAVAHPKGVESRQRIFVGDRNRIQRMAAFAALDLIRQVCAASQI